MEKWSRSMRFRYKQVVLHYHSTTSVLTAV